MAATFSNNTPGLVAILNNRPDFERAREQHWYRIPVRTAPDDILKFSVTTSWNNSAGKCCVLTPRNSVTS